MKDSQKLLRELMIALARGNNDEADRLLGVFLKNVSEITAQEITEVAQQLEEEKVFINPKQHGNIERRVFEIIKDRTSQEDLSEFKAGHPIRTFLDENLLIKDMARRGQELLDSAGSFTDLYSDWTLMAKQFSQLDIHYLRKENQLFPYLERKGFSHPSSIMWSLHDEIRKLSKDFSRAVEGNNEEMAGELLLTLSREAYEMTVKEERVLLPTAARLLSNNDWLEIREGEDEIGWMMTEPPKVWNTKISMDKHIDSDPQRLEVILEIINNFFKGAPVEDLKEQFKTELQGTITPMEFALAEQKMEDFGVDNSQFECRIEELIGIFKSSLEKVSLENLEEGHPLDTFMRENDAIRSLLTELRDAEKKIDLNKVDHHFWEEAYHKLWQINTHYVRKENQLFPYLETKGFDKPSTVMWALHDDIRNLIKFYGNLLDEKNYEELFHGQEMMFNAVEDMIFKEEKILWPTSLELLDVNEWGEIRKGEEEVGYCLIETPAMWNPNWKHPSETSEMETDEQQEKVAPVPFTGGSGSSGVGGINLEVGAITPEQINLIFKHLPFDVTYVDENDEVRYYNKGDDRVFPRSPGIIGRQVRYCHPPKSVHVVEKIVDAFKSGEKSEANFWINFRDKFVYIQYFAIRDDNGNYKGVLEVTYDGKPLRELEGEQRLLDWE